MGMTLATGTTAAIAKTYAAAQPFTAITNATEAVLTVTASAIVAGDIVEITSGWGFIDGMIARVKTATTSSITLEGIDTTDTVKFPAGSGIGSLRKISAWTQLAQAKTITASGGQQNYADATRLGDQVQRQIPTTRTPVQLEIESFEEADATWYADIAKADASRKPNAVLLTFPNGSKLYGNGYWTLPKIPAISANEVLTVTASVTFSADATRYAT